ncbi:hypothetical protein DYGSA30_31670 [Dyella sp. GSA-30]|nr:hypothetical protein DYGSA30_31670 [Dyella sp. GSA-30]
MDMMPRAFYQPRLTDRGQEARRCAVIENGRWLEGRKFKIYLDGMPLVCPNFLPGRIEREALLLAISDNNQNIVGSYVVAACIGEPNKLLQVCPPICVEA